MQQSRRPKRHSRGPDLKVLIAEELSTEGVEKLRTEFEVDVLVGLSKDELLASVADYSAIIVRSATQIDAEVIERASALKVVGRAGVGVDNIDVDAATRKGVVVVNAPQSNVLSAAEHTMALLLSLARNVPAADASTRAGKWERSKFTGVELQGKTLGILGLGRVGTLVAQRASAFGMRLVAYDPYISKSRAAQLGIEVADGIEGVLREADFLTVHLPKNPETKGSIGAAQMALMKPGVRIVNTSRGGLIDEAALVDAYEKGIIAGVAVDVFDEEPPGPHPFFEIEDFIVTPHLGASTEEAQAKAGAAIAEQVMLALRGEFAPFAVNVSGGTGYVEALRPYMSLTEKLGRIAAGLVGGGLSSVQFQYLGTVAEHEIKVLTLAGLKGLFAPVVHEPVTFVNAPLIAAERGIQVIETKSPTSRDFVNLVQLTVEGERGPIVVAGTLVGKHDQERIVRVFDYWFEMEPERYMCFLRYQDVPGVIGKVGTVLGEADINIAGMQVSRENIGGEALMGLTVDSAIPPEVLGNITKAIGATDVHFIDLGA
ncbi:MAG TPA: phosphoglycerate dehydrogenase [Actinomycetota bacterium]|nr:phosphoglycerate dehydrogenase [Actinomycetota bacterium]